MRTIEYEAFVQDTWIGSGKPEKHELEDLFIAATGIGGEAGEVQELLKKYVRDGAIDVNKLKRELGDVFYYITRLSIMFGFTLEDVMNSNVDKLNDRLARLGTLHGSGSDR